MLKKLFAGSGKPKADRSASAALVLPMAARQGEVLEAYDKLRRSGQPVPGALLAQVGDLYRDLGKTDRAAKAYADACERFLADEAWSFAEEMLVRAEQLAGAPSVARGTLALRLAIGKEHTPDIVHALEQLGRLLVPSAGTAIERVVTILDAELRLAPEAEVALGELLAGLGRPEMAEYRFRIALLRAERQGRTHMVERLRTRLGGATIPAAPAHDESDGAVFLDTSRRQAAASPPVPPAGAVSVTSLMPTAPPSSLPTDSTSAERPAPRQEVPAVPALHGPRLAPMVPAIPDAPAIPEPPSELPAGVAMPSDVPPAPGSVTLATLRNEAVTSASTRVVMRNAEMLAAVDGDTQMARVIAELRAGLKATSAFADGPTQYELGITFLQIGQLDMAVESFQVAYRTPATRLQATEGLAQALIERGDARLALRVLAMTLESSGVEETEALGLLYWQGRAHEALDDQDAARDCYERIGAFDLAFADVPARLNRRKLQ